MTKQIKSQKIKELTKELRAECKATKCENCPISIKQREGMKDGSYETWYKCPIYVPSKWKLIAPKKSNEIDF